jgi:hypothetical protein
MSTFKPPKVETNLKLYSLVLLYPGDGNGLILLHPKGGKSLILLSLAGKQFHLTYLYRKETNNYGKYKYGKYKYGKYKYKFVSSL